MENILKRHNFSVLPPNMKQLVINHCHSSAVRIAKDRHLSKLDKLYAELDECTCLIRRVKLVVDIHTLEKFQ